MEKISIKGGRPLFGKIQISGSKNSSLPILASCLLTDKKLSIRGVPKLTDTFFFLELLSSLGVNISNINKFSRSQKLIHGSHHCIGIQRFSQLSQPIFFKQKI